MTRINIDAKHIAKLVKNLTPKEHKRLLKRIRPLKEREDTINEALGLFELCGMPHRRVFTIRMWIGEAYLKNATKLLEDMTEKKRKVKR